MQGVLRPPRRAALAAAAALLAAAATACSCSGSEAPTPGGSGGAGAGAGADAGTGPATTTSLSSSSSNSSAGGAGAGGSGDWLHDPQLWEPTAADVPCDVRVAKLPSDRVPRRLWTPCGDGCLWAPALLGGQDGAKTVVATEIGGEIYYRVSSAAKEGDKVIALSEVTRLSDDEPANLLRHGELCIPLGDFNSPLLFGLWPSTPPNTPLQPGYFGLATAPGAPVVWQPPGVDMPSSGFRLFDLGGLWGLIANASTVRVATTPGSSVLETVFSSAGYALSPVGRGGQLTWSDWSDYDPQSHRARVRSWTQAGGSVELTSGPYDVMYIALSDTKMVWIGGYGLGSVEGATESAQLFWSPRATDPADVVIHDGPVVPDTEATTTALVTYGDWVATITNNFEVHNAVVVNLATQQIWSIPSRPGMRFGEVMAINETTLLLDERDVPATQFPKRIVRLDLTKLDSLTAGLQ